MSNNPIESGVDSVEGLDPADEAERVNLDPDEQRNREAQGHVDPDGNQQPVYRRQEPPA